MPEPVKTRTAAYCYRESKMKPPVFFIFADSERVGEADDEETAKRIVVALNSHETMKEALREIESGSFEGIGHLAVCGQWQEIVTRFQMIARAALKEAEGDR
jgi:hypothetical protein